MSYSVGQVAGLAGVTIRTLHHYDKIGLLSPSGRSAAGYRIYEEADLERLQQILFYRELEFALEEIATIVDDQRTDAVGHLRRQRGLLTERIERLHAMVAAIDHEMEAKTMGIQLTPEERLEVFGGFNPEDYAEEAEQRWGGTEAYRQSQRRVATYTKEDWLRIKAEEEEVRANLAAAFAAGSGPDSDEALGLPPRRTADTSVGGSTTAATRPTGAWARCTSTTSASGRTTTPLPLAWPSSSGTRPTLMPTAPGPTTRPTLTGVQGGTEGLLH